MFRQGRLYIANVPARVDNGPLAACLVPHYIAVDLKRADRQCQDLCHPLIFSEYLFMSALADSSVEASATRMKYGMSWLG